MRDLFIDSKRIDLASYIANNGTAAGTWASAPASPCPGNGFSFSTAVVLSCNSTTATAVQILTGEQGPQFPLNDPMPTSANVLGMSPDPSAEPVELTDMGDTRSSVQLCSIFVLA